jgi:hypothetical protein
MGMAADTAVIYNAAEVRDVDVERVVCATSRSA